MTIIDELLILLDDLGEASANEIPHYFQEVNLQVIFSSLGRLVNKGWVIKKDRRQQLHYSISSHGIDQLNATLDHIKGENTEEWTDQWHLVIFDIPEAKRKLRDSFRSLLKELCYGMLTSSVWISPWSKNEQINRFIKRNNLADNVFQLQTDFIRDHYQSMILVRQSWDWQKIENNYRSFIDKAEKITQHWSQKKPQSRFTAKKLVFQYAEVVKEDPRLPDNITPNATLSRKAQELYRKIRPYCLIG